MIDQAPVWVGSNGSGNGDEGREPPLRGLMEIPRRPEPIGGVDPSCPPSMILVSSPSIRSCSAAKEVCIASIARSSGERCSGVVLAEEGLAPVLGG